MSEPPPKASTATEVGAPPRAVFNAEASCDVCGDSAPPPRNHQNAAAATAAVTAMIDDFALMTRWPFVDPSSDEGGTTAGVVGGVIAAITAGVVCSEGFDNSSSARTNSPAVCGRSFGSLAKQRMINRASGAGSPGCHAVISGGGSWMCAASVACSVRPWNGLWPPSISKATTPSA